MTRDEFAEQMTRCKECGALMDGGCCPPPEPDDDDEWIPTDVEDVEDQ